MPAEPICSGNAIVEISPDGTVWTDISGWAVRVDPGVRERTLLTVKTFTGPKSCSGTADPTDIELEILYTELDTEPYGVLRAAHYDDTPIHLRWAAFDGGKQWLAAAARVPTWDEPEVTADPQTPLTVLATISADTITWETAV